MLMCGMDDGDFDYWHDDGRVMTLRTRRARRCASCRDKIEVGDECMAFARWRTPAPDSVAERIYGDEEPLATWYLCERCAGLYEALDELGFCGLLGQDLRRVAREYADMQREAGVFRGALVPKAPPPASAGDGPVQEEV